MIHHVTALSESLCPKSNTVGLHVQLSHSIYKTSIIQVTPATSHRQEDPVLPLSPLHRYCSHPSWLSRRERPFLSSSFLPPT